MTEPRKYRRLSHELLGIIGICAVVSLILYLILSGIATAIAEIYCFDNSIPMTELDWMLLDRRIFQVSAVLACGSFSVLFLALIADRTAYIRKITEGIDRLWDPESTAAIDLEGRNELTALALAVNEMSAARQELRQRELALAEEREQLIRALSHDIRTPLTAILACAELLSRTAQGEEKAGLELIRTKAEQIRDLTAVLLDGARRNPERFDNGWLLMEQLAAEFEEELEEDFSVEVSLGRSPAFSARLDVRELRRVFDNLSSNVRKYADPGQHVHLSIRFEQGELSIRQENAVLPRRGAPEGYGIGLNSIRRIAQAYGGSVTAEETAGRFSICIIFRIL